MSNSSTATPTPPGTALKRGLRGVCPCCGEGKLFKSYLKQVESCSVCGERFGHIRSDDAAPWLTILIVGHIIGPAALMVEKDSTWPYWVSMSLWPVLALLISLAILPYAKAVFLSAIWAHKAQDPH